MVDVSKHIEYWRNGAAEDWTVAVKLIKGGNTRHGLFFAHLTIEKILKAHVCLRTEDFAPKTHNLLRLAELAQVELTREQMDLLADMNSYQIESRYPEMLQPPPSEKEAEKVLSKAEAILSWLKNRL